MKTTFIGWTWSVSSRQHWQVTSESIALIPFSNSSFEKLLFHVLFLLITATAATVM